MKFTMLAAALLASACFVGTAQAGSVNGAGAMSESQGTVQTAGVAHYNFSNAGAFASGSGSAFGTEAGDPAAGSSTTQKSGGFANGQNADFSSGALNQSFGYGGWGSFSGFN